MENGMEVTKKTKNRATIWSSNPPPGHISGENHTLKDTWTTVFTAALFTIAKTWKQSKWPSTEEWIKKMWYLHIYNGILLSHKKEGNNVSCSNIDGPGDCHTKWSKSARERQISYDITYMQNLKKWYKWSYLQNRNRLTDIENALMVTRGEGWGGGIDWEFGID